MAELCDGISAADRIAYYIIQVYLHAKFAIQLATLGVPTDRFSIGLTKDFQLCIRLIKHFNS